MGGVPDEAGGLWGGGPLVSSRRGGVVSGVSVVLVKPFVVMVLASLLAPALGVGLFVLLHTF